MDLARMRLDYSEHGIDENDLHDDPLEQWRAWLQDAVDAEVVEPNAMVVATVEDGQPRTRTLLAKGVASDGIDFYTNYTSHKGRALGDAGPVSATFVWIALHRQVTFLGNASKVSEEDSDTYFGLRPREAQLGAWTSEQSSTIESREVLTHRFNEFSARFGDHVPRPPHWGGYRIVPHEVEFWQGRPNRLHDRVRYLRSDDGWTRDRLAP
ncbi:MAG: pyridoxamine 5'-phosphate oxidase [Acidimicrobiales bacterium]